VNERDIFDALREGDPAAGIDPQEAARLKARIRGRVLAAAQPQPARARVKKPVVVVLVALLALAAIAAAWYMTRQPTNPTGIGCHQGLGLDSPQHVVTPTGGLDPGECAPLWADRTITNPAIVPPGQIPPLTGCVNDAGTLTVFPTDDPGHCERLGMATYVPAPDVGDLVDVQNRLVEQINSQTCLPLDDAHRLVEQTLTAADINDWTVVVSQPATAERPCASLAFDHTTRQILLVPVPPTGP